LGKQKKSKKKKHVKKIIIKKKPTTVNIPHVLELFNYGTATNSPRVFVLAGLKEWHGSTPFPFLFR